MEFKVVFYIIVGIIWMIFNNYKKIAKESAKRNPAKPFGEIPNENWPSLPSTPKVMPTQTPVGQTITPSRTTVPIGRSPLKDARSSKTKEKVVEGFFAAGQTPEYNAASSFAELNTPSVNPEQQPTTPNFLAESIRNADFRQVIVLSEILQRPIN